ncbi:hypothetical protein H0H93_004970 [Arthromyces matolae]|nr:hypothetical protein H0H93_004970 [Arthromyces matolae]
MTVKMWTDVEDGGLARLSFSSSEQRGEMPFNSSRTSSSGSLIPFRFAARSDSPQRSGWTQGGDSTDSFTNSRAQRASTQSSYKGKAPAYDAYDAYDGREVPMSYPFAPRPSSRHKSSYDPPRPSTADAMSTKKARGSILLAASDAFTLRFGRKKTPVVRPPPPMPLILPGVIEITASRRDEEDEERDRLREVAAQSLGLQVQSTPETHALDEGVETVDEEVAVNAEQDSQELSVSPIDNEAQTTIIPLSPVSPKESVFSIPPPSPAHVNRFRSRSVAHSRSNSISLSPIPAFPATFIAINDFQTSGTMLDKYYQTSSLRIFALSKHWRQRFMVLSSPNPLLTRNSASSSYLHLFRSSAGEEKEIERLEINENSVVFIAEEEVGGRKHVVKVGGVDVGAMKKELNVEENGRSMWFLYISDPTEAQKWITVIKTAILGQRTVRAGLGLPTLGGVEPRGDMDVMLSMRAQGLITSPVPTKPKSLLNGNATAERSYASSVSSHQSQATISRSGSTNAVSAIKGFLTGSTRPRSASRAASIHSQQERDRDRDRDPQEESFGSIGHQLLGRPNVGDPILRPHSSMSYKGPPMSGPSSLPDQRLDRKILLDRPIQRATATMSTSKPMSITLEPPPAKIDRANRSLSLSALSLQPPPRKRWTTSGPARSGLEPLAHTDEETSIDDHVAQLQTGTNHSSTGASSSRPTAPEFSFDSPERKPPSIQSVSTLASAENHTSESSTGTKRTSRRWSRQGILPRRSSPPSGPPPSIPTAQRPPSHAGRLSLEMPPSTPSETGSTHSKSSQKSFISSLPSFSKRTSGSSVFSSTSSSQASPSVSRPSSMQSHRLSMPPQRPPPTSALPPAPDQDGDALDKTPTPPPVKPSFRDTVTQRAFRLSLIAPKPPPTSVLPPRPDEISSRNARRNSSAAAYSSHSRQTTFLDIIPASPSPPQTSSPPFPPPTGPLPPTPNGSQSANTSRVSRPISGHISLKKRLRILSAPSSTSTRQSQPTSSTVDSQQQADDVLTGLAPLRGPLVSMLPNTVSPPPTPIAEKIMPYQDDPSFLQITTPVIPHRPPPRALPTLPDHSEHLEIISLSPPPRRGSKQISVIDSDSDPLAIEEDKPPLDGERRLMSLSRPGSVVSLGFVSV